MNISSELNKKRVAGLSLRRGLALMATRVDGIYRLGTTESWLLIKTPHQLHAVQLLARGIDPRKSLMESAVRIESGALIENGAHVEVLRELELFIADLRLHNLIITDQRTIALPSRYLAQIHHRDLAAQQLIARSAPEAAQAQWSQLPHGGGADGGVEIITERARHRILISGRSRVATLIYTLLSQSGFSAIDFIDEHDRPAINDLDIGVASLTASALGGNYYQEMREQHRNSALFPQVHQRRAAGKLERSAIKPALIIHTGLLDIDLLVEWMTTGQPHMVIYPPNGDEVLLGSIVIPGKTPCTRCCQLYELDHAGFTHAQRIPLDNQSEVSMVSAYFIAAIAAAQALHFIDSGGALGEISYLNLTELHRREVVTLARHPLCGCSDLSRNHLT
jgi:hypothetical protein